jgi:hypothetical protein
MLSLLPKICHTGGTMIEQDTAGKKIFILYPHSVIQDEMLDILIMNGYETYVLKDHKRALRLLEHFPNSIMFINIDQGMTEKEWEVYIRGIQENQNLKECRLGILSYNTDQRLMQKYLMDMSVPCGYIQLKLGVQASTKIILDALQANEARGRRKFIRAACEDDITATMNYKDTLGMYYGKLLDISSAGIAVKIGHFGTFPPNSRFRDIQLKLRGSLVMADMILIGKRRDDKDIWIFIFDANMSQSNRLIIHRYIKYILQRFIDQLKL